MDPEHPESYLLEHSGLPGPRANLKLVAEAGDLLGGDVLRRLAGSDEEFLALCGTAGLGRLLASGDRSVLVVLRERAQDERWRVREGVAMALQRLGDADPAALLATAEDWAAGPPLVQRAAIAGVCEPRLLRDPAIAVRALELVETVMAAFVASPERDRVLRKALGYCWSIAVAAAPGPGLPAFAAWEGSEDRDVAWIVRENLRKARLRALRR